MLNRSKESCLTDGHIFLSLFSFLFPSPPHFFCLFVCLIYLFPQFCETTICSCNSFIAIKYIASEIHCCYHLLHIYHTSSLTKHQNLESPFNKTNRSQLNLNLHHFGGRNLWRCQIATVKNYTTDISTTGSNYKEFFVYNKSKYRELLRWHICSIHFSEKKSEKQYGI